MKKDYISKHDLAHEFFPDAERHVAVNHLMRWINRCLPSLRSCGPVAIAPRNGTFRPSSERLFTIL